MLRPNFILSAPCPFLQEKPTLSPALEAAIDYQLKVLSVAINYGGSSLLCYQDQFKEAILSAFDSPSWKVLFLNYVLCRYMSSDCNSQVFKAYMRAFPMQLVLVYDFQ